MANGQRPHVVSHKAQGKAKMDFEMSVCFPVLAARIVAATALANRCFLESETVRNEDNVKNFSAAFQNFVRVHGKGYRGSGSPATSQSRLKSALLVARMARFPGRRAIPT